MLFSLDARRDHLADADLQDDISLIDEMVRKFNDGTEIVLPCARGAKARHRVQAFKASGRLLPCAALAWSDVIPNIPTTNSRAIALRARIRVRRGQRVPRGLVLVQAGSKPVFVKLTFAARAWETKYPLEQNARAGLNGITSFSIRPLRIVTTLGLMMFALFIGAAIWVLASWLAGATIEGWTSP